MFPSAVLGGFFLPLSLLFNLLWQMFHTFSDHIAGMIGFTRTS